MKGRYAMSAELVPIGIIHSPYNSQSDAPRQGFLSAKESDIEVYEEYGQGLEGIEQYARLLVLYRFHRSRKYSLMVKPPGADSFRGVFASRSPNRPNGIGVCIVELIGRKGRLLKVRGLDALEGTPLLDIKPHIEADDNLPGI